MTISLGWWLVPLAVTVAAFWRASVNGREAHGLSKPSAEIVGALLVLAALSISLGAWLVWALAMLIWGVGA